MGLFKTKSNTTNTKTKSNTKSFLQALKTLKEFLSEGDNVPSLYDGNAIQDAQEFEQITTVDMNTMEQELDNYFKDVLGNKNNTVKKKLKKRRFSKKVIYTINVNTENGMKVARLKINIKYRNHQLQHMNIKLTTKNTQQGKLKIDYKSPRTNRKKREPDREL